MGVPLVATILSPLWVVNATSLAMDAVIVQVPPPPPAPKGALPSDSAAAVDQMGAGQGLRRIVTDDAESSGRSVLCVHLTHSNSAVQLLELEVRWH